MNTSRTKLVVKDLLMLAPKLPRNQYVVTLGQLNYENVIGRGGFDHVVPIIDEAQTAGKHVVVSWFDDNGDMYHVEVQKNV